MYKVEIVCDGRSVENATVSNAQACDEWISERAHRHFKGDARYVRGWIDGKWSVVDFGSHSAFARFREV